MSRTAATTPLIAVRGATWEDYLDYYEDDEITPIDLTGYVARMQVRTLEDQYGTTTDTSLLLELVSDGATPQLFIEIPPDGTVKNRVRIYVDVADHAALNPDNERRIRYGFGVQVYEPGPPDYVLPYARGVLTVQGELVR